MVIGDKFAWGHLGKTGGDSVKRMFDILGKRHILYADPKTSPKKHQTFHEKEIELGYDLTYFRKRILSIRRLPSWSLSYVFHKQRTLFRPVDFEKLYEGIVFDHYENNDISQPVYLPIDLVLYTQICGRIDYWLRTEFLADDFIATMSHFLSIAWYKKHIIRVIKQNRNPQYSKNVLSYFSENQIKKLYEKCPLWAIIESSVYESFDVFERKKCELISQGILKLEGALDVVRSEGEFINLIGWVCININGYLFYPTSVKIVSAEKNILISQLKPFFRSDITEKLGGFVGFDVRVEKKEFGNVDGLQLLFEWGRIVINLPFEVRLLANIQE